MPFSLADDLPPSWLSSDQRLVDVGIDRRRESPAVRRRSGGIAARRDRARRPRRMSVRREGRPCARRWCDGHGRCREPSRRSDLRALLRAPGGTIADLDGARIRAAAAGRGGSVTVRFTRDSVEVPTTWAGVPTSFTSSGLTPFGKLLKPDVTAPGAQILSSTLIEFAGDQFAVLDGTSFSAPHVAGVAALLTQRHPSWTPQQMKSALMSTAGPAFARYGQDARGVGARAGCRPRQRRPRPTGR